MKQTLEDLVLADMALSWRDELLIRSDASKDGVRPPDELIASGKCDASEVYRALANRIERPFLDLLDPDRILMSDANGAASGFMPPLVHYRTEDGRVVVLIAPKPSFFDRVATYLSAKPEKSADVMVTSPGALRAAVAKRTEAQRADAAVSVLALAVPDQSARKTATAGQAFALGASAVLLPFAFLTYTHTATFTLHVLVTLFFFACVLLRLVAAIRIGPPGTFAPLRPVPRSVLPRYGVIVALYREAEVIPQLICALSRLNWPRSKLDIVLACEADDHETLEALKARALPPFIRIAEVPPGQPRTKPKALMAALPLVDAEFLVLYDAEDRPHPDQLLEAYAAFRDGDAKLACLQAPLVVSLKNANPLQKLFAFEYASLFRGILPLLASAGVAFPLGGTSNHFRLSALRDVGGWDAYNVTEDADLGFRLARRGWSMSTLSRPTFEDAPHDFSIWLKQRTRWFKGWAQTWLVLMRNPADALTQMGWRSWLVMQVMMLGMIASSLCHPIVVVSAVYFGALLLLPVEFVPWYLPLFVLDVVNLMLGYGAFIVLGLVSMTRNERAHLITALPAVPLYWFGLSWAAWRALIDLARRPHHWDKTPHVSSYALRPALSPAE